MSRTRLVALGILLCFAGTAIGAGEPAAAPAQGCLSLAEYHRLDFWIGSWDVYVDGELDGHNEVNRILEGCAIQENWTDIAGYQGKSWFYLDPVSHRFKQVW